jgi:hypothetical protein
VSKRDEDIRRLVAELDVHLARVEADVAVLKTLLAEDDDEVAEGEDLSDSARG